MKHNLASSKELSSEEGVVKQLELASSDGLHHFVMVARVVPPYAEGGWRAARWCADRCVCIAILLLKIQLVA